MSMPTLGVLCLVLCCGDPGATAQGDFDANQARFHEKLGKLRWINYNPSTFHPERKEAIPRAEIEADLMALVCGGFTPADTGLCTYSCSPKYGLDQIPHIARELGFGGVILGVWTIDNDEEKRVARELARAGLVDAICVGNEGLDDRYIWDELRGVLRQMRDDTQVPVTTSEQIDDYGDPHLTDPDITDFVYPNIHPVFRGLDLDPIAAAEAAHSIAKKLAELTTLPVLVHETGWPSEGREQYTPESQRQFWVHLLKLEAHAGPRFVLFEAFDQTWKTEVHLGVDIGPSWGVFQSDRTAKPAVGVFRQRVGESRE